MTYGRVLCVPDELNPRGRGRKSLAELVRGEFLAEGRPPHPALRATFSPKGRRVTRGTLWSPAAIAEQEPVRPKRFT